MPEHLVFTPIPYTTSGVPLGSLVSNILRPDDGLVAVTTASTKDYKTRTLGDYDGVLKADVANGFFAQITRLLHLSRDTSQNVSLHVRARQGKHYELNSPKTFWESLVAKDEAQEFLTSTIKGRDSWFVTAVRTYIDAEVEVENGRGTSWTIRAEVPAGEIAQAATGTPIGSTGNIGGGVERKWELGSNESYRVEGERIFAIEFHKIIIMEKNNPASASIENGVMMRTHADFRGGPTEGEDFVVGFENHSESLSAYKDERDELEKVDRIDAGDGGHYIVLELADIGDEA
jgi:hypothetical protein